MRKHGGTPSMRSLHRAIAAEEKKNQENNAPGEKIKRKIVSSDLTNPPKNFTPLFGEVAKFRTLTRKDEQ